MSKYLNRKIKFVSLFSVIALVFSDNQTAFADILCGFAVPLLFIIAGYLIFKNHENIKGFCVKTYKNCFSNLLLPYLFWIIISGLFVYALSFINVLNTTDIVRYAIDPEMNFFAKYFITPPAHQLQYVFQLIIITLISPLIYFVFKYTKIFSLVIFACLCALLHFNAVSSIISPNTVVFNIVSPEFIMCFVIGAFIAMFNKERYFIKKDSGVITILLVAVWIIASVGITYLVANRDNYFVIGNYTLYFKDFVFLKEINKILGMVAIWRGFDHIFKRIKNKKIVVSASNYIIFIFAMYQPLLDITTQLSLMGNSSNLSTLIISICMPISVIAICILAGMGVKKISKKVFLFITGGKWSISKN